MTSGAGPVSAEQLTGPARTGRAGYPRHRADTLNALGLIWVLSRKNFQVRYKRATLGVLWAVLQPATQAAVLVFVFSRVITLGKTPHYALFVLCGVLPWAFFAQSVSAVTTSVVDNEALVKKVALPLVIFPLSAMGGTTLAYLAALPILLLGAVITGTVGFHLALLPIALLLELALIAATGVLLAGFHPAFRDIRYLVESALIIGFYATPVLYDPSVFKGALPSVLRFNPMTGVLSLYRAAILGRPVDGPAVRFTIFTVIGIGLIAVWTFGRRRGEFADLV